ncbi:MAG: hypothetical protein ACTSUE_24310 [Promethearchaeota archaeon]
MDIHKLQLNAKRVFFLACFMVLSITIIHIQSATGLMQDPRGGLDPVSLSTGVIIGIAAGGLAVGTPALVKFRSLKKAREITSKDGSETTGTKQHDKGKKYKHRGHVTVLK